VVKEGSMMREGRSPRLLTVLAGRGNTRAEAIEALYDELCQVDPERAANIDPESADAMKWIIEGLEESAPDGYPFGKNKRGQWGFWPLGPVCWPKGSLYDHL
jgi:hypothetical protein